MIKRDIIKPNDSTSLNWKEKKDFNLIIACISNVATLKKVNVKTMTSDAIMNFTKKYANEINEEYKRMEDMKKKISLKRKKRKNIGNAKRGEPLFVYSENMLIISFEFRDLSLCFFLR